MQNPTGRAPPAAADDQATDTVHQGRDCKTHLRAMACQGAGLAHFEGCRCVTANSFAQCSLQSRDDNQSISVYMFQAGGVKGRR